MARKDHKNDKRRITLPERFKAISDQMDKEGVYPYLSIAFRQNSGKVTTAMAEKAFKIIKAGIVKHVKESVRRNRK